MTNDDHVVDLKQTPEFVEQYVQLRNQYGDLLLTSPVNIPETRIWLERKDIEIRGIIRGKELIGVAILYLSREGEIAFFARYLRLGIGSRLLSVIETAAQERGLKDVCAWVLTENLGAQATFLHNGYQGAGGSTKTHMGVPRQGVLFRKHMGMESDTHEEA